MGQLKPDNIYPVVYEHDGIHLGDTIEYTRNGKRVTGVVADINPASAAKYSVGTASAALDPVFPEMNPVVVSTEHRVTPPAS